MKHFFLLAFFLQAISALAQGDEAFNHLVQYRIPEIALLDIETDAGSTDVLLGLVQPNNAGSTITFEDQPVDNLWLNYTSVINSFPLSLDKKRNITVKVGSGSIPNGIILRVRALAATNYGSGTKGISNGWINVSTTDQIIVKNIKSAYTGNGAGKGHNLQLRINLLNGGNQFQLLDANQDNTEITLIYTISDN